MDLQRDALTKADCTEIYEEKAGGKNVERIKLDHCLRALRPDNALSVWHLDRLGRSLPDLVRIVGDLESGGIAFEAMTEKIETGSAAGKLVFHVFAALAEFKRNLIRERTHAGLAAARARRLTGSQKPKLDSKQIREIRGQRETRSASQAEYMDANSVGAPRGELLDLQETTIYGP